MVKKEITQDSDYIDKPKLSEKFGKIQQKLGLEKRGIQIWHLKARLINAFWNRITIFQISEGLPEKNYNTKKMNWVGLHDPVELLNEARRIFSKGNSSFSWRWQFLASERTKTVEQ